MNRSRKIALITGGNRGIGFATAKKFLNEGYNVIISGRNDLSISEAVLNINSDRCRYVLWDISDISSGTKAIADAHMCFGDIDVFVNNAGVASKEDLLGTDFIEKSEDAWDYVMNTNLKGTYFAIQQQIKYMLEKHISGHIVNVCSEMGFRPTETAYGISKWGIRALTMGLGKAMAEQNIIVNGIAPGETATELVGNRSDIPKEIVSPRGIQASKSEIADAIYFLATQDNIVGEVIVSDGGRSLN